MVMNFANPNILWLLAVIPLLAAYYIWQSRKGGAAIVISTLAGAAGAPRTLRYWLHHVPVALRLAALAALIVALARPRDVSHNVESSTEGIDIVLAIDISGSMLARDFKPDRITAAKQIAGEFVADRFGDRIGVVAFAGEAFTQCPLTSDQNTVQTLLSRLRSGVIDDGTAIGNGLATSINRLRESGSKSKVVILLTDGVNNAGQISPAMASKIAYDQGIKVYTVGVGKRGKAPYPMIDMFGNQSFAMADVEIDEELLRSIAAETGGEYFRAENNDALKSIYDHIDTLEKSKVEVVHSTLYTELFGRWIVLALLLLAVELFLSNFILRRIP